MASAPMQHLHPSFWTDLPRPLVGLSPMDGVTDAACRLIIARHGRPGLIFTEFTAVEGLRAGAAILLNDFVFSPEERPVIAQLFGSEPDAFYQAAIIASALGFDGIDINMGCPAKNVTQRGAGAALIQDPARAREIIAAAKQGTADWAENPQLDAHPIHPKLHASIHARLHPATAPLPVSVKTRIGLTEVTIESWVQELAQAEPVAITIHGRTLKQLYSGTANWDAIATAVRVLKGSGIIVLGNGDISSLDDGFKRAAEAGTDGFLLGRAAIGNPWIFQNTATTPEERIAVALEHAQVLHDLFGDAGFTRIRKHLLEYTRHFPGAKAVRTQLSTINTLADVQRILADPSILAHATE